MKKIFPVLLVIAFVFVPFMSTNAFADELTYKYGTEFTYAPSESLLDPNLIFDDDYTTYGRIRNSATAEFTFNREVAIKRISIIGTSLSFNFFDSNGNLIKTFTTSGNSSDSSPVSYDVSLTNIKKVTARNPSGNVRSVNHLAFIYDGYNHDELSDFNITNSGSSNNLYWTLPKNTGVIGTNIYRNGVFLTKLSSPSHSYKDTGLDYNSSYIYRISAVYADDYETAGLSKSVQTGADTSTVPPANVSDISETHTDNTVTLKWTNPSDDDLAGFKIYRDGVLIATTDKVTSFTDNYLKPETSYTYKVVSFDTDGNKSAGSLITATTDSEIDDTPPNAPTGLHVSSLVSALQVSWDRNKEPDMQGYNVFVNGVKFNTDLVYNTSFLIEGLDNEKSYNIQVTAVDTSDNESAKSSVKTGMPSAHSMPSKMEADYSLTDVANGISSWFDSLWLILAFAIGIPLSFYVASRVKLLFLK